MIRYILILLFIIGCGGGDNAPIVEIKTPEKIDSYNLKLTHAPNKDQPEYFTTYTALYEGENSYFVRFYWNVKPNVYGTTYQKCDAFNNELKKFNVGKNEIDGMIKIQLMDFSGNILNERQINAN